jgi:hypothetical protein
MNICNHRSKVKTYIKDNDIIFQFRSPKTRTHKIHINNALSKAFKKCVFGNLFF